MSCDECKEIWDGNPPCDECGKPELFTSNALAWRVWQMCNVMGREGFGGMLQATNVLALLSALGGSEDDLEKVMIIESYYQAQQEKRAKRKE